MADATNNTPADNKVAAGDSDAVSKESIHSGPPENVTAPDSTKPKEGSATSQEPDGEGNEKSARSGNGKPSHDTDEKTQGGDGTRENQKKGKSERKEYEETSSREPQLAPRMIAKTRAVFVPWEGLERRCTEAIDKSRRIIVVCGERGTGRFTAGIWLGLKLLESKENPANLRVVTPLQSFGSGLDLESWALSDERQKRTAYILRNPINNDLAADWLTTDRLLKINQKFGDFSSWLIMTAEPDQMAGLDGLEGVTCITLPKLSPDILKIVLDKHVDWLKVNGNSWDLGTLEPRILEQCVALIKSKNRLRKPPEVARFLEKLPLIIAEQFPLDKNDEKLLARLMELAAEVTDGTTQSWFAQLSPNAQLLALLAEAFQGIQRPEVEDIYCNEAQRLREETGLVEDPRRFGFDDLYRQINVHITSELTGGDPRDPGDIQLLEFVHEDYRREIQRQIRSRHHLLWGVVNTAEQRWLPAISEPWQASQRQNLGEVIARLGIHRPNDLKKLMLGLAQNENGIIASVPGYILRGVCRLSEPGYRFVCAVLQEWVGNKQNREPDLVWAAVAAIWRVYAEIGQQKAMLHEKDGRNQQLEQVFKDLETYITQVADSGMLGADIPDDHDFLTYAVQRMFQALPADTGRLVQSWLESGGSKAAAGRRAARRLYLISRQMETLPEAHINALLELVGPVLRLDQNTVDGVLEILMDWIEHKWQKSEEEAGKWRTKITGSLIRSCNRARDGERYVLRRALTSQWLRTLSTHARDAAQTVITRARLMDGVPVDLPGAGIAALIVDASDVARVNNSADRLTQELFEFLRPQVDLWVAHLGNSRAINCPGQGLDVGQLHVRSASTRILMPWIESFLAKQCAPGKGPPLHFIFTVHWAGIVDGDDAEGMTSVPVVCLHMPVHLEQVDQPIANAAPQPNRSFLEELVMYLHDQEMSRRMAKNEQLSVDVLSWVDFKLGSCLSRALANRTPDQWWELLVEAWGGIDQRGDEAAGRLQVAIAKLEILASQLDDVPANLNDPDPMRLGMGIVQWMAQADLVQVVKKLNEWARLPRRDPRGNFAGAAATMLLKIYFLRTLPIHGNTFQPPPSLARFLPLIEFSSGLARRGSVWGVEVYLIALRYWVADEAWASAILGSPALRRLVDDAPLWLCGRINALLDEWTEAPIPALGEKQMPDPVKALKLRLKYYLATSTAGSIIPDKAVLVICHGSHGPRGRIGNIAWELYLRIQAQRKQNRSLPGFIFTRAGARNLILVSAERASREAFETIRHSVGIMAPIFEKLKSSTDLFVVVLADQNIIDAKDWLDERAGPALDLIKSGRLKLFWDNNHAPQPSKTPGWTQLYQARTEIEAVDLIQESLKGHFTTTNQ